VSEFFIGANHPFNPLNISELTITSRLVAAGVSGLLALRSADSIAVRLTGLFFCT